MATLNATRTRKQPVGMPASYVLWPFSVNEYHRLVETGILTEDDPVELLEGCIVAKMPHNPPHDGCLAILDALIREALKETKWINRIQSAITLSDSEPEPDLTVAVGPYPRYFTHHPEPSEIGLVAEVADSSLLIDQVEKQRIYARAGMPVYWIVNLIDRRVEIYTNPIRNGKGPRYRTRVDCEEDEIAPLMLKGKIVARIPVAELMP